MNVEQLRYFIATIDEKSFSGAARALSVTTQCVSKAVGNLEKELGVLLIERTGQGAHPTEFGYSLAQRARVTLRTFDDTVTFAHEKAHENEHFTGKKNKLHVIICAPYFTHINRVTKSLAKLVSKQLEVCATITFCACTDCMDFLEGGRADIAVIIGEYQDSRLDLSYLGSVPCGIQVAASSPLAHKKPLLVEDVLSYPVYLWLGYDFFNNYVRRYFAEHNIKKNLPESSSLFFNTSNHTDVIIIPRIASIDDTTYDTVPVNFDAGEKFAAPIYLATLKTAASPLGHAAQEKLQKLVTRMYRGDI